MATPETKLSAAARASTDGPNNHHSSNPSSRHLQNFNTFQFVSQLVSATPPYLFNMSTPFPGNFFSDLLRRMAPRSGTPGLPLDATLQQHIRAALLAKGAPPPAMPPTVMPPPPLDIASLAAQHRQQHQSLAPTVVSSQEKGTKRSLFSDVNALSGEDDSSSKRPRLEETREERRDHPAEGLTAPFLMQPPFLPSSIPPPPDVLPAWPGRASLMRPQMPIPAHVPPTPLDPYRLLLDLRLAGQLRSMAATQALHHKDSPTPFGPPVSLSLPRVGSRATTPPPPISREIKVSKDEPIIPVTSQSESIKCEESRLSAFHPPGRPNNDAVHPETSDEDERRSTSSNSNCSSNSMNREGLGPQYIFKHLTEIYRTIDHQRSENEESGGENNVKSDRQVDDSNNSDLNRNSMEDSLQHSDKTRTSVMSNGVKNEVLTENEARTGSYLPHLDVPKSLLRDENEPNSKSRE